MVNISYYYWLNTMINYMYAMHSANKWYESINIFLKYIHQAPIGRGVSGADATPYKKKYVVKNISKLPTFLVLARIFDKELILHHLRIILDPPLFKY